MNEDFIVYWFVEFALNNVPAISTLLQPRFSQLSTRQVYCSQEVPGGYQ